MPASTAADGVLLFDAMCQGYLTKWWLSRVPDSSMARPGGETGHAGLCELLLRQESMMTVTCDTSPFGQGFLTIGYCRWIVVKAGMVVKAA